MTTPPIIIQGHIALMIKSRTYDWRLEPALQISLVNLSPLLLPGLLFSSCLFFSSKAQPTAVSTCWGASIPQPPVSLNTPSPPPHLPTNPLLAITSILEYPYPWTPVLSLSSFPGHFLLLSGCSWEIKSRGYYTRQQASGGRTGS